MHRLKKSVIGMIGLAILLSGAWKLRWSYQHPGYQQKLDFRQMPYSAFVHDLDGNGWPDLTLVSHGANEAVVWRQQGARQWLPGVASDAVGFHPGFFLTWPDRQDILLGAEGEHEIRKLKLDDTGQLTRTGALTEESPVELKRFNWPDWGNAMVARPFQLDSLTLFKGFDVETMAYSERVELPLAKQRPSLMFTDGLTVLDADRDGVDEIYLGMPLIRQVRRLVYPGAGQPLDQTEKVMSTPMGTPKAILSADFNEDGFPDLLVPDNMKNGWIHVLFNDKTGHFQELPFPNLLPGKELQGFALERDRDGRLLLMVNATDQVHLLRFPQAWAGDPAGLEMRSLPKPRHEAANLANLVDLDQDGWLDALVGLDRAEDSAWLCYGPIWEHFEDLRSRGFLLD